MWRKTKDVVMADRCATWKVPRFDLCTVLAAKLKGKDVNDRGAQMPNETHLKRLISDAVFETYKTHGKQAAGDTLHISREHSRIIASAVFDVLSRANVLLIDQPNQPNV
jgi:hypothetical protein